MNNWKYVPFKQLFDWEEKSKIKSGDGKQSGKYKMFVCSDTEIKRFDDFLCDEEALVFGTGGKASCHYIFDKFAYSTDCIVAKSKFVNTYVKFYYYYLRRKNLSDIQSTFSGSGLQHTSKKKIENILVPLIEFEEQKRIVKKIEELFSELDAGVETLKKTKAQLEVYRQSVLKETFSGFTDKTSIRNMSKFVTSGSRGWAKFYSDIGARFIRITDLTRDSIKLKNDSIQYVDLPENAEGKRSKLKSNDVLVSITADLGSIALIPNNIQEAYINQHIAMIRLNNPAQGEFIAWYLKSDYGQKDLLKNKRGGGKLGLGLDDIRDTKIPIVTDEVAFSTVFEINQIFSICDSIEKVINDSLLKAEALRQSILKKAFEGEL